MPPLIFADCYECNGEGYFADEYGTVACEACNATGQIEVCAGCLAVPKLAGGYEVCGCVTNAMKEAA